MFENQVNPEFNVSNHKNYNILDCGWFKETPIFTYLLARRIVIEQLVIGEFNYPVTIKVVV